MAAWLCGCVPACLRAFVLGRRVALLQTEKLRNSMKEPDRIKHYITESLFPGCNNIMPIPSGELLRCVGAQIKDRLDSDDEVEVGVLQQEDQAQIDGMIAQDWSTG